VGLVPVVIHGAGLLSENREAKLSALLAEGGEDLPPDEALSRTMLAARSYMEEASTSLAAALAQVGVEAEPFLTGVFEAHRDGG